MNENRNGMQGEVARFFCRVCNESFPSDDKYVYEKIVDHIETKHPKEGLPYMQEVALLLQQEEK